MEIKAIVEPLLLSKQGTQRGNEHTRASTHRNNRVRSDCCDGVGEERDAGERDLDTTRQKEACSSSSILSRGREPTHPASPLTTAHSPTSLGVHSVLLSSKQAQIVQHYDSGSAHHPRLPSSQPWLCCCVCACAECSDVNRGYWCFDANSRHGEKGSEKPRLHLVKARLQAKLI
jgi:hypothetical protein